MYLSDYDREKEKDIRRMDIYSLYFRIMDQKERTQKDKKPGSSNWP